MMPERSVLKIFVLGLLAQSVRLQTLYRIPAKRTFSTMAEEILVLSNRKELPLLSVVDCVESMPIFVIKKQDDPSPRVAKIEPPTPFQGLRN